MANDQQPTPDQPQPYQPDQAPAQWPAPQWAPPQQLPWTTESAWTSSRPTAVSGWAPPYPGAAFGPPTPAPNNRPRPPRRVRRGVVAGLSGAAALAMVVAGGLGFGLGRETAPQANGPSALSAGAAAGSTGSGSGSGGGSGSSGSGNSGSSGTGSGGLGSGSGRTGGSGSSGGGYGTGGSGGTGGGYGYGGGSAGSGGGYAGGSSGGGGTPVVHGKAATSKQSIGIVDINTRLGYDQAAAAGTGIVLTSGGEILTNNHVVEGATSIFVKVVSTGKSYSAKVVGTDATDDVAVLQLATHRLATAPTAIGAAKVGAKVIGVGNAGGTGHLTAATGKVIGLHRSITTQTDEWVPSEHLKNMIETNADIQAGDSGGPLYNATGTVIGIDTAGSSGPNGATGMAIPISAARTIAAKIEAGHASSTITIGYPAFLGVEVSTSTPSSYGQAGNGQAGNGQAGNGQVRKGALIGGVLKGTSAVQAGLVAGDTITAVGATSVSSAASLSKAMAKLHPGQSVRVAWVGPTGRHQHATVTLTRGPAA